LLWKGRLKHTKLDQQLIKSWKNYDANM
jgi:hypothetical protein